MLQADRDMQLRVDRLHKAQHLGELQAERQYREGQRKIEPLFPLTAECQVGPLMFRSHQDANPLIAEDCGGPISLNALTYEFWVGYRERMAQLLDLPGVL